LVEKIGRKGCVCVCMRMRVGAHVRMRACVCVCLGLYIKLRGMEEFPEKERNPCIMHMPME
jgi:hypothetical protein